MILNFITQHLGAILITLIVFFVIRELIMWYWKINERVTLQQQILEELKKISSFLNNVRSR